MHPFLSRKRRGGKRKADFPPVLPSWPMALRKVRSWLEPYVMLVRYWRAFSDLCPRPRSYESCLRGCSPERAFTSMSADNKLPVVTVGSPLARVSVRRTYNVPYSRFTSSHHSPRSSP